jgi:hypothetical protein
MVLNDVVDQRTFGEPLASVLAGRDPKTVKLATAMFIKEQVQPCNPVIG